MVKELKFKCPECGSTELDSLEAMIESYKIIEIPEEGEIKTSEKSDLIDSGRKYVSCSHCGFVLREKNSKKIVDDKNIVKWIKEHCPQE